jgi:hypothetical protein
LINPHRGGQRHSRQRAPLVPTLVHLDTFARVQLVKALVVDLPFSTQSSPRAIAGSRGGSS